MSASNTLARSGSSPPITGRRPRTTEDVTISMHSSGGHHGARDHRGPHALHGETATGGLETFTRMMAHELKDDRIHVRSFAPGHTPQEG